MIVIIDIAKITKINIFAVMAIYTLDQAINIIFNDREYYLSLSKSEREKIRKYRLRHKKNILTTDTKIAIITKYGGIVEDIKVHL